jgi:hypothetical protein
MQLSLNRNKEGGTYQKARCISTLSQGNRMYRLKGQLS